MPDRISDDFQNVRREQQQEGARMAREERGRRPILTRGAPKDKVKPKGHEAFLKQLEASGTEVIIEKVGSRTLLRGTVKCSDKYTITLRCQATGADRVIFKHDISEFRPAVRPISKVTGEETIQ
jgi:sRNA-binding regulator protein Hfq